MKRRINFTGRKKIPSEDIRIQFGEVTPDAAATFSAEFTLPAGLPDTAKVYVEPYHGSSSMRFDFGTVGSRKTPSNLRLTELDRSPDVLFRVKVVDEREEVGKIVAAANRIRPADGQPAKKSLLPLVSTDLGEDIWRVLTGGPPVLQINNRIPGLRDRLMTDPILQGAIYPHALRIVLTDVLGNDEYDDDMKWVEDWKTFATELKGEELPEAVADEEGTSELIELVDDLAYRFCQIKGFATAARSPQENSFDD
jgi:hypothetical protein